MLGDGREVGAPAIRTTLWRHKWRVAVEIIGPPWRRGGGRILSAGQRHRRPSMHAEHLSRVQAVVLHVPVASTASAGLNQSSGEYNISTFEMIDNN